MKLKISFWMTLLLIGLSSSMAAAESQIGMIKIAQYSREVFVKDIHDFDFRLSYIKKSLRDELVANRAILLDTTGLPMPESKVGVYKLNLVSDSVPIVFADIIQRTAFENKGYPLCIFIQEGRASRLSPEVFVTDPRWRDAKINPGDIVILSR